MGALEALSALRQSVLPLLCPPPLSSTALGAEGSFQEAFRSGIYKDPTLDSAEYDSGTDLTVPCKDLFRIVKASRMSYAAAAA